MLVGQSVMALDVAVAVVAEAQMVGKVITQVSRVAPVVLMVAAAVKAAIKALALVVQSESFGPEQHVHSHLLVQEICNEPLY